MLRTKWLILPLVAAVVAAGSPLVGGHGSAPGDPSEPLFTNLFPTKALAFDPWAETLWLGGSQAGLLHAHVDLSSKALFTHLDGLPSNQIRTIVPAREGVWVGTSSGLAFWDRSENRLAPVFETANGSLMRDEVLTIHVEDPAIWVGTQREGLFKLETAGGPLVAVDNPVNDSRFTDPIRGLATDGDEIWISATGYGVVEWHRDTGEAETHDNPLQLFTDDVYAGVVRIVGDEVWIGTSGEGARRYNRTTEQWQAFANPDNLDAFRVFDIEVLGHEVWFATETGVSRYSYRTEGWHHWNGENGFPGWSALDIAVGNGQVWSDSDHGVAVYDRAENHWDPANVEGSNVPSWTTITDCTSYDDGILFATGGGGVATYTPTAGQWNGTYGLGPYGEWGLPDRLIWSLDIDEDAIWLASNKGLARHDVGPDDWSYYRSDGVKPPSGQFHVDRINEVEIGPGTTWIASSNNGLGMYDTETDEFVMFNETHGLSSSSVFSIAPAGDEVWVGTALGLDRFDVANQTAERVYPSEGNDTIFSLALSESGETLWVGTTTGSLRQLDTRTGELSGVDGIEDPVNLVTLAGDYLWTATFDGRLIQVPLDGGEAVVHDELVTTPSLGISCIVPLDSLLYVGTTWGVHRLSLETGRWLPQQGLADRLRLSVELLLESPASDAVVRGGESIPVRGQVLNATGPVEVRARLGTGAWAPASLDGDTFELALPTGDGVSGGGALVHVEVLRDGTVLARQSVPVTLELPDGSQDAGGTLELLHDPPIEAVTGDPIVLEARLRPPTEHASIVAIVQEREGERLEVPLEPEGGSLHRAELGPYEAPTVLSYRLQAEAGEHLLVAPPTGSPFGASYPLTVLENPGFVSITIEGGPLQASGAPGEARALEIPLQNTGTRDTPVTLHLTGEAEPWIQGLPSAVPLKQLSTRVLQANVTIPLDAEPGTTVTASLEVVPQRDPGASQTYPIQVQVVPVHETSSASGDGPAGGSGPGVIPAPGLAGLLVGLSAAVGLTARRKRRS